MWTLQSSRAFLIGIVTLLVLMLAGCSGFKRKSDIPDNLSAAHRDFARATDYYQRGCFQQALDAYQAAHERFSALDNRRGVGLSLEAMANVYHHLDDYQSALLLYDEALAVFSGPDFKSQQIYVMANKAAALVSSQQLDAAEKLMEQARSFARMQGTSPILLERVEAIVLLRRNKTQQAASILEKALARAESEAPDQTGALIFTLARAKQAMGQSRQALELYQRCLEQDRRQSAHDQIAEDLAAIAELYASGDNPCQAVDYFKRAAKIEALLGRNQRAVVLTTKMTSLAGSCGIDPTAADFFISRWASGKSQTDICR